MSRCQTIYQYFNYYTKSQVDTMLSRLSDDEMRILTLKYGDDLDKPVYNRITDVDDKKAYNNLVSKMKRLLENPNLVMRPRKKKVNEQHKKMLEGFKSVQFNELLNFLTPKEAVVFCLKFDVIDGKHFSTEEIADFLKIEKEEVIDIAKKALLIYKERLNGVVKEAIEYAYNYLENDGKKYIKK